MSELWDVYDKNRNKTGRTTQRGPNALKEGEYHIIVTGIILNSKNELLLSKRAEYKKYGLMWEFNTGSVLAGETKLSGFEKALSLPISLQNIGQLTIVLILEI